MLRNKSKLTPLSRQQFESMFSINSKSKPPSPEIEAIRAPDAVLPLSAASMQIFKIAEDADEKLSL